MLLAKNSALLAASFAEPDCYSPQHCSAAFSARPLSLQHVAGRRRGCQCRATADSYGQHAGLLEAAIESRGLAREDYDQGMQELLMLLPSLQPRFSRLSAHLLVELAENPSSVAQKLAELKQLFPSADIFRIINRRPSLLLDREFGHVELAASKLHQIFPEADVGLLVEQQPLLLVEDVDECIEDLRRLMPAGVKLEWQLLNGPDIFLSVQRGSRNLGPGAEF